MAKDKIVFHGTPSIKAQEKALSIIVQSISRQIGVPLTATYRKMTPEEMDAFRNRVQGEIK
ncbi:hypothetical protein [Enterococcus sp. N249-2]